MDADRESPVHLKLLRSGALFLAVAFTAACGASPLGSNDGATSTIRFSLERLTSAGIPVCDETDLASMSLTPRGESSSSRKRPLTPGEACGVEFTVTVPRGRVDFAGRLAGRGRTLMRGGVGGFLADRDGFVVEIPLVEVEALDVETRTIGLGGPATYTYSVAGSDLRFPIGLDDADTLAALAGGPRRVTIHPEPCTVVNGPAERDVMIPAEEARLGHTMFEIDCNEGGDVDIIVGPPGSDPPDYTVFIGDQPPHNGGRDSMRVSDVTPGPLDVRIDVGGGCIAEKVTEEPHFLPSGGHLRVEFRIHCGGGAGGGPPGGGGPGDGPPPVKLDAIRVVTRVPHPPLPGEITTFDAWVTGASAQAHTLPIGVPDSVTFQVSRGDYPYAVDLTPTGSCVVRASPSVQTVLPPATGGFTRVVFDVIC